MEYRIKNGAITYGANAILEEINFEILNKDKIAIIGRNGCGKTSLLKALVDNDIIETGLGKDKLQITKIGNPIIGYLDQQAFTNLDITLLEEILKLYKNIIKLKIDIEKLEDEMAQGTTPKTIELYTDSLERYKQIGGYTYQKEYETALSKFGFNEEDKQKKLSEFSGGQLTKISFLKLLLSKPDILLLDEPTNHLDLNAVEWLESYLNNYPKALVVVSHDRMFLDKVVNIVYEIEYASLTKYKGNYSAFERQKRENYEKQLKDYDYQQKEIKRLKSIADRFKYKPSKASMAMSKLKKIEQMNIIERPKHEVKNFHTKTRIEVESGKTVLSVKELVIGYKYPLAKLSFEMHKGQKIAIIGQNGKGKSTFIKTLMGLVPKIGGKFTFGFNVYKEYFDQQLEFTNENNTVFDEFKMNFPELNYEEIRKSLSTFLFVGEDINKNIKTLSGGEKVRLRLCIIFKKNCNLLLLDEPTNHLDIVGKENLETILNSYEGSVLFVSHDRYFINKVADSLLVFEKNEVKFFNGSYQEYLNQLSTEEVTNTIKEQKRKISTYDEQKTKKSLIRKLEKEISIKEKNKKEIETQMLDENVYHDYKKMNELQSELKLIEIEIDSLMTEWININQE